MIDETAENPVFELRWRIIHGEAMRDSSAGAFLYAVMTTGIYCRPDCRSRKPGRVNTRFFDDWQSAERAGYRPCKRCHPRGDDGEVLIIQQLCEIIDRAEETPSLAMLAEGTGLSPERLRRLFRTRLGMSPREYARARRRRRLRGVLAASSSVTEAFYEAGYGGSSRFYEDDGLGLGMKPDRYRRGGEGETIAFLIVDSPLGRMLVARTGKGVCAIDFGASDAELEAGLRRRFCRANVKCENDGPGWREVIEAIVSMIEQPGRMEAFPLDIRGTVFEERVWHSLMKIPCGETRSYGEIAKAIGAPSAIRAVAGACARNPLLLAIPCHRVVRGDGSTGGYRAGAGRKARILDNERRVAEGKG